MQRPEVRIIQDQQIENKPSEVSGWEAEQLLRKYGHTPQTFSTRDQEQRQEQSGLSFEEMIKQEELRIKEEEMRRYSKTHGPRPTTFSGERGYDAEIK
jgi:hypothetical protein